MVVVNRIDGAEPKKKRTRKSINSGPSSESHEKKTSIPIIPERFGFLLPRHVEREKKY
jgi:hypothetical protein